MNTDPTEDTLKQFKPITMPAEWKAELIENSLNSSSSSVNSKTGIPKLKIFMGAIAASWVAIIALNLATPSAVEPKVAKSTADISLLAKYIQLQNDLSDL